MLGLCLDSYAGLVRSAAWSGANRRAGAGKDAKWDADLMKANVSKK